MSWTPKPGMRVKTVFGVGIVTKAGRHTAHVHLDEQQEGFTISLALSALTPVEDEGDEPSMDVSAGLAAPPSQPTTIPAYSSASLPQVEARLSIEALRFGLVPRQRIEALTLDFDGLKHWVLGRLPDANSGEPQISEIWGPFGTGKSHTMQVIRHIAQRQEYLTARVEVDGRIVSLSDPEKLLFSLWTTVSAPDLQSSTFLLDLNLKSIDHGHSPPKGAPGLIDRVAANYETAKLLSRRRIVDKHGYALDAIMSSSDEFTAHKAASAIWQEPNVYGPEVQVKRMIGIRVLDRPNDFVHALSGYSLVAQLAGYKGLVITIDEFEVEEVFLSQVKFDRIARLLRVLTDYLSGATAHPKAPLSIFVATVGQEGHRGDLVIDKMLDKTNGGYYPLEERTKEDRLEVARRIHEIYREAYTLDAEAFDPAIVDVIEERLENTGSVDSGIIRAFIKRYVAALDSQYQETNGNGKS